MRGQFFGGNVCGRNGIGCDTTEVCGRGGVTEALKGHICREEEAYGQRLDGAYVYMASAVLRATEVS